MIGIVGFSEISTQADSAHYVPVLEIVEQVDSLRVPPFFGECYEIFKSCDNRKYGRNKEPEMGFPEQ